MSNLRHIFRLKKSGRKWAGMVAVMVAGFSTSVWAQTPSEVESYQLPEGGVVAVYGDYAVVGEPLEDLGLLKDAGAAYIYKKNTSGQWNQVQQLVAPTGNGQPNIVFNGQQEFAEFGSSVAITENSLVIGAPKYDLGFNTNAGVVYYYEKNASGTWIVKDDLISVTPQERLGEQLSASGDLLAVSSRKHQSTSNKWAVYTYELNGSGSYTSTGTVASSIITLARVAALDILEIPGDDPVLAVGVPLYDNGIGTLGSGAVFMYRRYPNGWSSANLLSPGVAVDGWDTRFGSSVALGTQSNMTVPVVMIGDPWFRYQGLGSVGAVYSYWSFDNTNNTQNSWGYIGCPSFPCVTGKFHPSDPASGKYFGRSLDMKGNKVLIGSGRIGDPGNPPDQAYFAEFSLSSFGLVGGPLQASGVSLTEEVIYEPSVNAYPRDFSKTVAVINDNAAMVGAPGLAPNVFTAPDSAVYVYDPVVATQCNGKTVTVNIGNGDLPTSGDDVILGTSGSDTIVAMGGDDTICGLGGNDDINGGRGNDWIDAGAGDDTVQGANDNDEIYGDTGVDTLYGGPGDDQISGEEDGDTIYGNSGNDTLSGNDGVDKISGGSGNDIINTGSGSNLNTTQYVTGGNGDDTINGGPDADVIRGEAGNDTIKGDAGNDKLYGGSGEDDINGQSGDDLVRGNAGNDTLRGGLGDDQLDGLGGQDFIYGGYGDDTLNGSTGNDTMYGEAGNDSLHGGGGNDVLNGGVDTDDCDGAGGNGDSAISCETQTNIP